MFGIGGPNPKNHLIKKIPVLYWYTFLRESCGVIFFRMKVFVSFFFFSIFIVLFAFGQQENKNDNNTPLDTSAEKSPTTKFLTRNGYMFPNSRNINPIPDSLKKWPDTVYFNTAYRSSLLGSPTIPISFSKLEYVDGKYQVTPTVSLGIGYTWFTGTFIFTESDKIMVDPVFFFGLIVDAGLTNDFALNKLTGFFTGGFVGIGPFNIFFGYDYIIKTPTVGLGARLDLYTVYPKILKPVGKVREVRSHKRMAPRIENE